MVGKLFELGGEVPYRHPEAWARQPSAGPERLVIGAGQRPVEVLDALGACLLEPLFVLAVVRVPRTGSAARFESHPLTRSEVTRFLEEFGELFEDDARAELWVGATTGNGLLVLDEHDLLYAYGPLDDFEAVLSARGFAHGAPTVPAPHEHHYNEELDPPEVR